MLTTVKQLIDDLQKIEDLHPGLHLRLYVRGTQSFDAEIKFIKKTEEKCWIYAEKLTDKI